MQKLNITFKRIAIFGISFFILNLIVSLLYLKVVEPRSKLYKEDKLFFESTDKIEYLFLGNSRVTAAVITDRIPNCSRLSTGGESSIQTYYKLKYILEKTDKQLKYVVLPIGYPSIGHKKPEFYHKSYYWKKYINFLELGKKQDQLLPFLSIHLRTNLFPYYEFLSFKLLSTQNQFLIKKDRKLFFNSNDSKKEELSSNLIIQQNKRGKILSETSLFYFNKTIELAEKHDIFLCFVRYPIHSSYSNAIQNYIIQNKININVVDDLIADSKIAVTLDFRYVFNKKEEYFKDSQHLNRKGRLSFTKIIAEKINQLENK